MSVRLLARKFSPGFETEFIRVLGHAPVGYDALCKTCQRPFVVPGKEVTRFKSCGCRRFTSDVKLVHLGQEVNGFKIKSFDRPSSMYVVECKRCGRDFKSLADILKKVKSCGCFRASKELAPGEAAFRQLFLALRSGAKFRGHDWALERETNFRALVTADCRYCGLPPSQVKRGSAKFKLFKHPFVYNGIDRVENTVGYTPENTVSCCKHCNFAKASMGQAEFYLWVERCYSHLKKEGHL